MATRKLRPDERDHLDAVAARNRGATPIPTRAPSALSTASFGPPDPSSWMSSDQQQAVQRAQTGGGSRMDARAAAGADFQTGRDMRAGLPTALGTVEQGYTQHGRGAQAASAQGNDPFADMLNMLMQGGGAVDTSGIEAGFDAQKQAILDSIPLMQESAGLATDNIGGYFDYAAQQAERGGEAVGDVYDTAQRNVGSIYDQHGKALSEIPGDVTALAEAAAGGGVSQRVAEESSAATAPFLAAGESSRAGGLANLERRGAAAETYMSELGAASGSEAALRQSDVEQRLAHASSQVQQQAAAIEADKQTALAQYSADSSVDMFNRMLDVMQLELAYDQHQLDRDQFEAGTEGGAGGMDSAEVLRQLRIGEMTDPYEMGGQRGALNYLQETGVGQEGAQLFDQVLGSVQTQPTDDTGRVLQDRELLARAMEQLASYTTETEQPSNPLGFLPWVDDEKDPVPAGGAENLYGGDPQDLRAVEEAFRIYYGG